MAERRMFSKTIIDSDAFTDMPLSTQALYFHLSMRADDDGFLNNPKRIQRMIGCTDDDLKLLTAKRFIIPFDSGVVVIKHWRIHNYIQSDRYKETNYTEEKSLLGIKKNKAYTLLSDHDECTPLIANNVACIQDGNKTDTECIHDVSKVETQVRLGKDSIEIDKDSVEEVNTSCEEPIENVFIYFPLIGDDTFAVTDKAIAEWQKIYIGIDVQQEVRNMCGWLIGNPTKRKTKRGIGRFINSWLSRAQDEKGGRQRVGANGIKIAQEEDHTLDGIF